MRAVRSTRVACLLPPWLTRHELTSAVFLSVQTPVQAPTLPAVPELPEVKIPGLSEFKASVAAACTPALHASCCVAP